MSRSDRPIVGSVFERKIPAFSATNQPKLSGSSQTGFPVVQHRSKSAFARGRDESKRNGSIGPDRTKDIPIVQATNNAGRRAGRLTPKPVIETDLRRQISEENEKKVEGMSKEERDQERRDIIEHFGVGISDLLQKAREARERRLTQEGNDANKTEANEMMDTGVHSDQDKSDSSSEGMSLVIWIIFDFTLFRSCNHVSSARR
jgi:hypothetical protein